MCYFLFRHPENPGKLAYKLFFVADFFAKHLNIIRRTVINKKFAVSVINAAAPGRNINTAHPVVHGKVSELFAAQNLHPEKGYGQKQKARGNKNRKHPDSETKGIKSFSGSHFLSG